MNSRLLEWIGNNKNTILSLNHWKKIKSLIQAQFGKVEVSAQEFFDFLHPDKIIECPNAKFIGLAVGYRTCQKNCACYKKNLSEKVSDIKSKLTDQQRQQIAARRRESVREKYGVDNVFQCHDIKAKSQDTKIARYHDPKYSNPEKRKLTNIERYGVENVWSNKDIHKKTMADRDHQKSAEAGQATKQLRYGAKNFNNSQKAKETCQTKYGVSNPSQIPIVRDKISRGLRAHYFAQHQTVYNVTPMFPESQYQPGVDQPWKCNRCGQIIYGRALSGAFSRCKTCYPSGSTTENEVKDYVRSLGFEIDSNTRKIISPLELDILVPEKNLAVEFCGLYWHAEQKGKTRQYHRNKLLQAHQRGIRLITIMSDDWEFRNDIVKSRLASVLGVSNTKIYARQCHIMPLESDQAREFLEKNHLQGWAKSPVNIGLFHYQDLVSVMTFSKSRFESRGYELVRFASLNGVNVVGAASKLLEYAVRSHAVGFPLITYSDNSWGFTDFYPKLGFKKISDGSPGYHYINLSSPTQRINRMNFQKHKLQHLLENFDSSLTEYNNMLNHGYDRVWDCGHSKYVRQVENLSEKL
jgi:hypothetical protein